jgi:hypothetical protein
VTTALHGKRRFGARYCETVPKPITLKTLKSFKRYRIAVPTALSMGPYRITHEAGLLECEITGSRGYYPDLRISDGQGIELARLRRAGRWWWPKHGYELLAGGDVQAYIRETGGHLSGRFRARLADGRETVVRRDEGEYTFSLDERLIAKLGEHPQPEYDLQLASGTDPLPIVATCVVIDLLRRSLNSSP